jgi:hypothetical protein
LTAAVGTAAVASLWLINKHEKNKEKSAKVDPESSVRKIGHTSHIHIPTENVKRTKDFFEAFGLIDCSTSCDTTTTTTKSNNDVFTILTCPNPKNNMHQPYIILEKTNATKVPARKKSHAHQKLELLDDYVLVSKMYMKQ